MSIEETGASTMVRVIAGRLKHRVLRTLKGLDTRPTSDRLRETLFNLLQPEVADCRFLDCFAGSGGVRRPLEGQPLSVEIGPARATWTGFADKSTFPERMTAASATACMSPLMINGVRSLMADAACIRRSCCASQPVCQ